MGLNAPVSLKWERQFSTAQSASRYEVLSSEVGYIVMTIVLHPHEQLWVVPDNYYDDYRPWYGRIHKNVSYTCFEYGQLLVIGPTASTTSTWQLTGKACLFIEPCSGWKKEQFGTYCRVFTPYNRETRVSTYRLAPIEVCEVATPEGLFKQKHRLVSC